jgi:hypothetical protein
MQRRHLPDESVSPGHDKGARGPWGTGLQEIQYHHQQLVWKDHVNRCSLFDRRQYGMAKRTLACTRGVARMVWTEVFIVVYSDTME